ncbi:MAG: tetrahydrodipicolinate N-succinyltransferase N-terminal domain-containing protein, partial [Actinomycetota bacterium]
MTKNAWGVGLATIATDGSVLDTRFRALGWGDAVPGDAPHSSIEVAKSGDPDRGVRFEPVRIMVDTSAAPQSASDVYLRLHLLSHRLAQPRTLNLDGAFGLL